MNSSAKTILGLLAAGAAGVAIGMLLAPDKGSKTRKTIKDKLSETSEDLSEVVNNIISSGQELLHFGKERLDETKNTAASKANELRSKANEVKEDIRHEGTKIKNALS